MSEHPYRDAVVATGLVFVSGSLPLQSDDTVVGGRRAALDAAMETARRRIGTVGAVDDVVKATDYLTDMALRDEANEPYRTPWLGQRPARPVVEVTRLPHGSVVEIDIVARAPGADA